MFQVGVLLLCLINQDFFSYSQIEDIGACLYDFRIQGKAWWKGYRVEPKIIYSFVKVQCPESTDLSQFPVLAGAK